MAAQRRDNIVHLNRMHQKNQSGHRFKKNARDPMMDFVCGEITERGLTSRDVHKLTLQYSVSGVSATTIDNWLNHKTRKPQAFTLGVTLAALGYSIGIYEKASNRRVY